MSDTTVVIVGAARSPIGSLCGALSTLKAHEISTCVIKELLKNLALNPSDISEVILGQALAAGQGQNPARQASMNADVPFTVPAYTINKLCGSGLKSVVLGCQSIKCGDSKIIVCGGQESMSQAPHCILMRSGLKMGNGILLDTMVHDGLTDAFQSVHMGITAEKIANMYNISRKEQDEFAVQSQLKTQSAQKSGHFFKEIVPIEISLRKGNVKVTEDEYPRHGTSMEVLEKLKPAFAKDGTITAGNASGVNDGSAIVVLTTQDEALKRKMQPLAKIVAYAEVGVDPSTMGLGPIPAIKALLSKCGWQSDSVDLWEINEAFAAQVIAVVKELNLDLKKVNVSGGAIALGHPIGASGARVLVTLLYGLERIGASRGVAALCIGGGMGIAMAIERQ